MSSSASHKGDVHGEKDIDRKGYKKRPSPEDPFAHLKLSPHDPLINASRTSCTGPCAKKRRYFCAECLISLLPQGSHMPQVHLPVKLHILQAGAEQPQRSTAQHIPLLSPDARVWRPFPECIEQFKTEVVADAEEGSVAVL